MKKLNYLLTLFCLMAACTWAFAHPANNECSGAIDLSASLGQGAGNTITTGPYDNTDATTEASDPTEGYDDQCFGEPNGNASAATLENTLWFSFMGDGNLYLIEATRDGCELTGTGITDDDTQMAIYSGDCGSLTPVACNEDGPNADYDAYLYPAGLEFATEAGVQYYVMVDGFNFLGSISMGEYCVKFTQVENIACNNPNVSGGTVTMDPAILCQPDSVVLFSHEGVLGPNEGDNFGYVWMVSSSDLMGTTDPVNANGYLGAFPIAASPDSPAGINFAFNNLDPGIYYFTLYAFGNATTDAMGALTFDAACTFASNSAKVEYYPQADCPSTSILDVDEVVLGMSVFPNPAQDVVNLNISAQDSYAEAILMITNVTGKVVQQQQVRLNSGANTFDVNVADMPAGVYIVSIESETHQAVTKFVKQ